MAEPMGGSLSQRLKESSKAWMAFAAGLGSLVGLIVVMGVATRSGQRAVVHAADDARTAGGSPGYTADGKMLFPEKYREWIYLTTGHDMNYTPVAAMAGMSSGDSMFDNVFVNPEAYRFFQKTGTWPDKTVILIEARGAKTRGSINKSGQFQGTDVMALEVHVKDEARTPGAWAFYEFDGPQSKPATMVPRTADCYSCHEQHAAVDTTFVQFYPTLSGLAKEKGTLSAAYLKDEGGKKP